MAIANTLTGLQGQLYSAVDIVSREMVGFLPSISINAAAARAEKGDAVKVPISSATTGGDIAPAMTAPAPANKTITTANITIDKSRFAAFGFTGEETLGLDNGVGYQSTQVQEIAQAVRTLVNEMEADAAAAAYLNSSRAYGTAATTPFASDLSDTAQALKILMDNGAPVMSGWNLVMNTTAGAKMRTLTNLTKANEAGGDTLLRQGVLLDVHGGMIRESGQVKSHTKGTGTGYLVNLVAGYDPGDVSIVLDTGSGTVLAGDVVTFAGDTNKYVVKTGVAAPGTIVLEAPGLKQTLANNVAMTIGGTYTANCFFTPNAIQLAARMPAMPPGGDSAVNRMTIIDPRSGIPFEFAEYKGYHQNRFEVTAAWGVDKVKPEHSGILLG